jgi:catechol-2,3-dioxygenase
MSVIERLGHVGIHVRDLETEVAFYRDVVGLQVADVDEQMGMAFMSSDPEAEHHELVLMAGRSGGADDRMLQQISFRATSLQGVLDFNARLVEAGVPIEFTVTHGNAISVYFFDPEGNRLEMYWPTGLPAKQPYLVPLDFTQAAAELLREVQQSVAEHGATGYIDPRFAPPAAG